MPGLRGGENDTEEAEERSWGEEDEQWPTNFSLGDWIQGGDSRM
jgi:hypothetical protein